MKYKKCCLPADLHGGELVRAFVPVPDVWRATGVGSAAVVHRSSQGRLKIRVFLIELLRGGLYGALENEVATAAELDEHLCKLRPLIPPMTEGDLGLAADYVWGAHALCEATGGGFEPGSIEPCLGFVPRPQGSSEQWLARLTEHGGLTPPALVELVRSLPAIDDALLDSKEVMVFTDLTLAVGDARVAYDTLVGQHPDFAHVGSDEDGELFSWTREYPRGHWSPGARLGGRQVRGSVRLEPGHGRIVASAQTLSRAARLLATLHDLFEGDVRLRSARWVSSSDRQCYEERFPERERDRAA